MNLRPSTILTEQQVEKGLGYGIGDGLASEVMTTLTSGAFLVAIALAMGATNFQIGLLAALPTMTNLFQLLSIWLVRKYNNRRAICVLCSLLGRIPLLLIGVLPLLIASFKSINTLLWFMFFYNLFASISGPSWNAWMKDLVPENKLGEYFAKRGMMTQALNVLLSITVALVVFFIKAKYPQTEITIYYILFAIAGISGIVGVFVLAKVPEPVSILANHNIFKLFKRPLADTNFRRLLTFNSAWVFALNIATPFFTVFMMKTMGLPLPYIIALTVLSQISSILTIRLWGNYADRYSNKTIIAICAPLYILVLIAWCFVGIYTHLISNLILLAIIHIVNGISTSGINLSLTNIGLKLAPKEEGIVYLSVKNIVTAIFSSIAPLIGGQLADYFNERRLIINVQWASPKINKVFHLISLHEWNFLFLIGALLAFIAVEFLGRVRETGEVEKDTVVRVLRSNVRNTLKDHFLVGSLIDFHDHLKGIIRPKKKDTIV